jgi:predicted porin
MWIEGRYRITPRIFVAARADTLGFSKIADSSGRLVDWDAEVARFEVDAGYYVQRNLMLRLAVQHNDRDGGRVLKKTFVSGQVAYWF